VLFRNHAGEAGYLAIIAVDATARVSTYYPPGPTAAHVVAGRDIALSTAVELDATLGRETIIAVRCPRAEPVARLVTSVDAAVALARAQGRPPTELGALALPPGCVEGRQGITKVATLPATP
jgi:hypothetical protein